MVTVILKGYNMGKRYTKEEVIKLEQTILEYIEDNRNFYSEFDEWCRRGFSVEEKQHLLDYGAGLLLDSDD